MFDQIKFFYLLVNRSLKMKQQNNSNEKVNTLKSTGNSKQSSLDKTNNLFRGSVVSGSVLAQVERLDRTIVLRWLYRVFGIKF